MNNLKFRVWSDLNKEYNYITLEDLLNNGSYNGNLLINDVWEQYTGFKNKSGEMCIGDIVKTSHRNLYVSTYRGSLVFRDKDDISICLVDDTYYENTITIGTINENKELL